MTSGDDVQPEPRPGEGPTTIVQSARYGDVLGLLFGALGASVLARGLAAGTGPAVVAGAVVLVAVAAGWARFRLRPRVELRVSDEQLCVGRSGGEARCFTRGEVRLRLHGGWRQGLSLLPAGAASTEAIPLLGFDSADVINACTAHGWHLD